MHLRQWFHDNRTFLWTCGLITDKDLAPLYFDFCWPTDAWIIRLTSLGLFLWAWLVPIVDSHMTAPDLLLRTAVGTSLLLPSSVWCVVRLRRLDEWVQRHAKFYYYLSWFIYMLILCVQIYAHPREQTSCGLDVWNFMIKIVLPTLYPGFTAWLRLLWLLLGFGVAISDSLITGTPLPIPRAPVFIVVLVIFNLHREFLQRRYFLVVQKVGQEVVNRQASEQAALQAEQEALRVRDSERQSFALLSHEIRTPMGAMLAYTELLQGTNLSAKQSEYLAPMGVAAGLLSSIINDILDHFKLQEKKFTLCLDTADIRKTFKDAVAMLQAGAAVKNVTLELKVGSDVPQACRMDAGRVQQMLNNLVSNAIKFTPNRGTVTVTVSRVATLGLSTPGLKVEVYDTGVGVPLEHQAALFQPFTQAGAGIGRKYGGTGLGLSIVRMLAEIMGGGAEFWSQPGQGSCFWFTLALAAPGEVRDASPAAVETLLRKYKLLVVDDTPLNLQLMSTLLSSMGLQYVLQDSGEKAIEYIRACSRTDLPDVVLMDCWMPNLSGFEATEAILSVVPSMPIFILTADSSPDMEERALACGMLGVLQKPVRKRELVRVCNRWGNQGNVSSVDELPTYTLPTGTANSGNIFQQDILLPLTPSRDNPLSGRGDSAGRETSSSLDTGPAQHRRTSAQLDPSACEVQMFCLHPNEVQ